jgi:hypothetical protein
MDARAIGILITPDGEFLAQFRIQLHAVLPRLRLSLFEHVDRQGRSPSPSARTDGVGRKGTAGLIPPGSRPPPRGAKLPPVLAILMPVWSTVRMLEP